MLDVVECADFRAKEVRPATPRGLRNSAARGAERRLNTQACAAHRLTLAQGRSWKPQLRARMMLARPTRLVATMAARRSRAVEVIPSSM